MNYFFRQLFNSFGVFFRTIRAYFTRQLNGVGARLRRITNFSRHATRVASETFQTASSAIKAPTKREDYIETKGMFISKSFLISLLIGLIILGLLIYFVIWPFLLSRFFTAHFWQEDEKVEDWSGKAVVYYDEEKDVPMYSGKLEEGVLQGKGKLYDENGLVTYEGNFVDGLRSGKGKVYAQGVLVYEGTFLEDEYSGEGTLYENGYVVYQGRWSGSVPNGKGTSFADGVILYAGDFIDGVYSGEGTLYDADGGPLYKGGFADGLYEGEGILYHAGGQRAYVGSFAEGRKEGEGSLYREDGTILYKGSFAEDLYDGEGTLYLEDGRGYIEGSFAAGVSDGDIRWFIGNKLWYDGGAVELVPDGYGEIYLRSGKKVYAGEFDRGTIDGQWLLSLTAAEVREAFAEASVTEAASVDGGFYIINRELGLVARCSYQSSEEDSKVFSVWISRQETDAAWIAQPFFTVWSDGLKDDTSMAELLPWEDQDAFHQWILGMEADPELRTEYPEHNMTKHRYYFDGWYCTAAIQEEGGLPVMVSWTLEGELDAFDSSGLVSEDVGAAQQQLDQLLLALGGVVSPEEPAGKDAAELLGGLDSAADAKALVSALLDIYENNSALTVLESSRSLLEELTVLEQEKLTRGDSSQAAVDALLRELDSLDLLISQSIANREKGLLTAQRLTGQDPMAYDLSKLLVSFDPVELDMQALCDAALEYASGLAAGRYTVDAGVIEVEVKAAIIDLTVAHQTAEYIRQEYENAVAAAEKAAEDFAKGSISVQDLLRAQLAQNDSAVSLYRVLSGFVRLAEELNHLTGGMLSRQAGWMADGYPEVFEREVANAEAEAEAQKQAEQEQTPEELPDSGDEGQDTDTQPQEPEGQDTDTQPQEPEGQDTDTQPQEPEEGEE